MVSSMMAAYIFKQGVRSMERLVSQYIFIWLVFVLLNLQKHHAAQIYCINIMILQNLIINGMVSNIAIIPII